MDEDDAIKYNNAIQALNNSNKKFASLIKDHIIMTNTALNHYNETLNVISTNEARLNDAIDSLITSFKNASEINSKLYAEIKLNEMYNELSSSLLTLSFKIENVVNAIMFTKSHSIHPSVLTPTQLYNELVDNVRNLDKHKELPVSLSLNNIHTIIDVAKLLCIYVNNKIVYIIKIPLVNRIEYSLYKSIPIPIPHDNQQPNSYAMVLPNCKHVAISSDKNTYICFSNLRECIIVGNEIFICNNVDVHLIQNSPICETEMLCKIPNKLPLQCKTKLIFGQIDIWQELKGNRWLFVETEPIKLTVECQTTTSEYKLLGTGILNLKTNCKAYSNYKEFIAKSNITITVKPILSDFNLIDDPCCDKSKFNLIKPKLEPLKLLNVNLDKITSVANNRFIADIDEIVNEPNPLIEYKSYYPIMTFSITIVIIIIILYKLLKEFGKCPKRKQVNITDSGIVTDDDQEVEQIPIPRIRIDS